MKVQKMSLRWAFSILFACFFCSATVVQAAFRPPAVPLVANNPYFSIWSFADRLTYDATRHWTGTPQELHSMIRIDGNLWRLMGKEPRSVQALPQVGLTVLPTRTIYDFEGSGVHVTLTFLTPMIPSDLDLMSWPVTFLTWQARSVDGKDHDVSIYYDNTAQLVVNTDDEAVVWSRKSVPGLDVLSMGTKAQPVLQKFGDNLRIDWGYLYVAAPSSSSTHDVVAPVRRAMFSYIRKGRLPEAGSPAPVKPNITMSVMAFDFDLGKVGSRPVDRHIILAYDQIYSIEYFHQRLRPYWRLKRSSAKQLVEEAEHSYKQITREAKSFDRNLMADLVRAGGHKYGEMAALAYRQSLAAQILVAGPDGQPFFMPKENFSNGCIDTVDVVYPGSPILLLLNPRLLEASLVPLFKYAESDRWPFPFAPHDLGTYPLANGQVYGGGTKSEVNQMPVEETGNMLLMVAAIAHIEGNAGFAHQYWHLLTKWANYLKQKGLDPENQLSTDDFAGHLAHNANLSIKAIEALEAYSELAKMLGDQKASDLFASTAKDFAGRWVKMADDGDHYRLAFDQPGTWSQKYNLVWDKILDFHIFPATVASKEVSFYGKKENQYGFPLDNRRDYTKLDWEFWSATLANSRADWNRLTTPIWNWVNQTPSRVPMTDWYWTTDGTQVGFQARSVVGGLFIKMLANKNIWERWAKAQP